MDNPNIPDAQLETKTENQSEKPIKKTRKKQLEKPSEKLIIDKGKTPQIKSGNTKILMRTPKGEIIEVLRQNIEIKRRRGWKITPNKKKKK